MFKRGILLSLAFLSSGYVGAEEVSRHHEKLINQCSSKYPWGYAYYKPDGTLTCEKNIRKAEHIDSVVMTKVNQCSWQGGKLSARKGRLSCFVVNRNYKWSGTMRRWRMDPYAKVRH